MKHKRLAAAVLAGCGTLAGSAICFAAGEENGVQLLLLCGQVEGRGVCDGFHGWVLCCGAWCRVCKILSASCRVWVRSSGMAIASHRRARSMGPT